MQLIDEENDVTSLTNFVHDLFQSVFELTAVFCPCYERAHIKYHDAFVAKCLWHFVVNDLLSKTFDDGSHTDRIAAGLGQDWLMLQTAFKPYNCCYVIHAPLEAFVSICRKQNIRPDDIEKVAVGHSAFGVDHVGAMREPTTGVEAQFSCNFMLAVALVNGPPGEYDVTDAVVSDPKVRELAAKITMYVDATAEKEQFEGFGSLVTVTLRSGQQYKDRVRHSKGTPQNPMTLDELETKFRKDLEPFAASPKVAALLGLLRGFLALDDLNVLTTAMTAEALA